jgi:hypothetical protein
MRESQDDFDGISSRIQWHGSHTVRPVAVISDQSWDDRGTVGASEKQRPTVEAFVMRAMDRTGPILPCDVDGSEMSPPEYFQGVPNLCSPEALRR